MRTVFLGNHDWSVPTLEAVATAPEAEVVLVLTNPPRAAGRGSEPRATPVADAARRLGLELVEADGIREGPGSASLRAAGPDLLVVVAYGQLLPAWALALPRVAPLNVHFSLLPRWRGAAPVQRAILAGDERTGVTVMRMDEGLDTGPIVAQREEAIRPDDDAGSLGGRLASLGAALLLQTIRAGDLPEQRQDDARSTPAPSISPEERWLVWEEPAAAIERRIRALSPRPGARTRFRGADLRVLRASVALDGAGSPGEPGALTLEGDAVDVATGEGRVRLLEVGPAGRAHMPATAWARGARIEPGERLG